MGMKQSIKRAVQHVAARVGPQCRTPRDPRLLVLMYHRVLPATHPDIADVEPGMMVTPDTLDMQLGLLRQHFTLMTLVEWLTRRAAGQPLPAKTCVVTFDDGWRDNADHAFPLLQKHQVPATIFLVSDWMGTQQEFWPERLARLLRHTATQMPARFADEDFAWLRQARTSFAFANTAPTREQLNQIFLHCKQWRDDTLHERLDALATSLALPAPTTPALMDWQQVSTMADSGLVEFGSHTRRHIRLNAQLDADTMAREISLSSDRIAEAMGQRPRTFCYPNGDYTEDAVNLVRQNYQGAVTTRSGWNTREADSHLLQRIGIHDDISRDPVSFLARLSGWV